jgi:protease-4
MPPPTATPMWVCQPRRSAWRGILIGFCLLIFCLSVVLNVCLMIAVSRGVEMGLVKTTVQSGAEDKVVALYKLHDVIDSEAAERFEDFYREIVGNSKVKAVVLRVDSPGGAIEPSDRIHELVGKLRTKGGKKIVVSMGAVAASGGYYVSAPADCIVAEETTITGSIGVIMAWAVLKGTLEKIGVESVVIKSQNADSWKDEVSPFRQPDDLQRAHLKEQLNKMQKRFEEVVRQGRGDKLKLRRRSYNVEVPDGQTVRQEHRSELEPFNGKIYMSREALELGLIDEIGYQDKAVAKAKELAGVPEARVVVYRAYKSLLGRLLEVRSSQTPLLDARLIERLQSPQIMLMWKAE